MDKTQILEMKKALYHHRNTKLKIFTNTGFEGHWPVPTAAVVIAKTKSDAKDYLDVFLREAGLKDCEEEDFKELSFTEGEVVILSDGDY